MSRSKVKCPKCDCVMEDTGTNLCCENCKDFYYNLTSNKENRIKRRELKKHMSKFTTDDLENILHEIIVKRAEAERTVDEMY